MSGISGPPVILVKDRHPYELTHRHTPFINSSDDTPRMHTRWHYAVDVPKRRLYPEKDGTSKSTKQPSKFVPFPIRDSRSLEKAFNETPVGNELPRISVNEDHLFEVNIAERELGPVYWEGPVYTVIRGTWHFQEGNVLRPCDEILAVQIEEGYRTVKPFRPLSGTTTPELSSEVPSERTGISSADLPPNVSKESMLLALPGTGDKADLLRRASLTKSNDKPGDASASQRDHIRPLFGAYTGKFVLYTNKDTAWLLSNDLYGKLSKSFFQSVTRGVHMGGQKLVRGYTEPNQKVPGTSTPKAADLPPISSVADGMSSTAAKEADAGTGTAPPAEEAKTEMEADYDNSNSDSPDRKVNHLILCCHGIGQKLSERVDSVNFVHDVNVLRRNLKKTFQNSKDLQTLAQDKENSGIQVLPVRWRQAIQFGMSREYDDLISKSEADLAETKQEEEDHATLEDITIERVQGIRNIVSDVLLDILLYYQPNYREQIVRAVSQEMNRVYLLYKERNPEFDGKVSIMGHSLGSAIAFDILCRQPTDPGMGEIPLESHLDHKLALDFPVENFYAIGSPIGLFQMLRGKNIASRKTLAKSSSVNSPLLAQESSKQYDGPPVSYPKVGNYFNIFHPSDPVSYRIEPLISKHTAKLKPYSIPYTKSAIRNQLVGLTGLGHRAFEGASSYWVAIRSSITNAIVSKQLGYTNTELAKQTSVNLVQDEKNRVATELMKQHESTLYNGFRKAHEGDAKNMEIGEQKLQSLNRTGRVDFSIQEDLFGSSYMSAISAHLACKDVTLTHVF